MLIWIWNPVCELLWNLAIGTNSETCRHLWYRTGTSQAYLGHCFHTYIVEFGRNDYFPKWDCYLEKDLVFTFLYLCYSCYSLTGIVPGTSTVPAAYSTYRYRVKHSIKCLFTNFSQGSSCKKIQLFQCMRHFLYLFSLLSPPSDKTIKLWKVSERDKRAEGYNLKEDSGTIRDPTSIKALRYV